MTAHVLAPEAIADLDVIVETIAVQGGNWAAAETLISALTQRFHLLTRHPFLGRARADLGLDRRSYSVGNYVIIYRVVDGAVQILRVVHGRRDIEGCSADAFESRSAHLCRVSHSGAS